MGPWHVKMPHKTCWGCDCCWCWCLETCWRQFVADLEAKVLVIKLNFCSDFEHKVWSRLKLRRDFEAEFWSVFCSWGLVEVIKFNLEARFGQDFEVCLVEMLLFGWDFEVDTWSRFWWWNLIKICVWTCDMNSTLGSVVPLAMFSPSGAQCSVAMPMAPQIYWYGTP